MENTYQLKFLENSKTMRLDFTNLADRRLIFLLLSWVTQVCILEFYGLF